MYFPKLPWRDLFTTATKITTVFLFICPLLPTKEVAMLCIWSFSPINPYLIECSLKKATQVGKRLLILSRSSSSQGISCWFLAKFSTFALRGQILSHSNHSWVSYTVQISHFVIQIETSQLRLLNNSLYLTQSVYKNRKVQQAISAIRFFCAGVHIFLRGSFRRL